MSDAIDSKKISRRSIVAGIAALGVYGFARNARAAEDFARNDPYVKNGVARQWKVRPWTVVVGNEEPRIRSSGKD